MIISFSAFHHRSTRLLWVFLLCLVANGSPAQSQVNQTKIILLLGDSISAAYGMSLSEGWATLLQQRLDDKSPGWRVVNASISGETSAGAGARLPALLKNHKPELVVIELGGNDGLRGYPLKHLRENLSRMVQEAKNTGAQVILLGMEIPPNYGARYADMFRASFAQVAEQQQIELVPFFLDGVATNAELMQADGIHPTVSAQALLLDNVWPRLNALLRDEF